MSISVEELLERVRAALDRVPPEQLEGEVEAGALLVDIRPSEQRERDGYTGWYAWRERLEPREPE
ncbi:MAG: hypothetical protein BMS9Abin07_0641 [Acidimicrobiia bacterium]|nr:MAG: hypothetical protein BMS9Abin07_0641 [Acidimicrobiia bacterium]